MTKKDFFILIIKLFGLSLLISSLFSIPSILSYSIAVVGSDYFGVKWVIASVLILFGFFIILIYMAPNVVEWLKLEKGFDDDRIEINNLDSHTIVKIAILLISGCMMINHFPNFLTHSYFALKTNIVGSLLLSNDKLDWAISGLNVFFGYLLFTNYHYVSSWIHAKDKELKEKHVRK